MKKSVCIILALALFFSMNILRIKADNLTVSESISDLYGLSALLMDAETGEVLFERNGQERMAVASTTKILTCILALEHCRKDEVVTISANAASQPDVQMNASEGEEYILLDLLKGMMLESYNDISVAIAEHVSGTTEAFSDEMNRKAKEIGCENSFFITPNGLDAEVNGQENQSTANDLALIMSYAIRNEDFLSVTQTSEWQIDEINGKRSVFASNKNRFLNEYEGMLSGKTGFTGKAGYCYVGAAKRDDRTFVAVTLGSGWPPHKNYKWSDIRKLLDYGFDHFEKRSADFQNVILPSTLPVLNGVDENGNSVESIKISFPEIEKILINKQESYIGKIYIKKEMKAPVGKNEVVGKIELYRNNELIAVKNITVIDNVEKNNIWKKIYNMLRYIFVKIRENLLKLEFLQGIIN